MKKEFVIRIRLLTTLIVLFALVLISRLYLLQIVHGSEYADKADRQYVKSRTTIFERGGIYFQDKAGNLISGATLQTGFLLAINPSKVVNPAKTCEEIKKIFEPIKCDDFVSKASKKTDSYKEIIRKIDEESGKKIIALKLNGVSLYKDTWRYYPGGTLAAHLLGFVGYKGNELAGRYGLESTYESVLKRNGENSNVNFFAEMFANINRALIKGEELEGDIVTTIDPTTQTYIEEQIKNLHQKWNAESVGAIIINPMNGEIHSMALTPTFDPNDFRSVKNSGVFINGLVENVYEMGSVIKPLTMAAGIDAGVVNANTKYDDTGSMTINNRTIYNFDKKGRGVITLQEALGRSLNTGFVYVKNKMGNKAFADYLKKFGLGEKTGIDLPNEARGLIDNLKSPRDIEYATASYGQGIAITPVAAVRAISALANGGTLITPHIAKKINYKLGHTKDINHEQGERVIKRETSEEITRMLVHDFDVYFQDGAAKNEHYSIAVKTGTAQIALPNGKGYYDDRNLHSFFGYLPAYNPKFLVYLYTVHPKGVRYSSESLGPTFVEISKFLINYYDIPPDR
jgi:stage V sporulation protein D (sporulation-specific penicillin-binding protein)